jgi:hypothetical protein
MGECDGFRGFARNVAAASSELKVIIWDRRNMGRSEVSFGTEPLAIEEAENSQVRFDEQGGGTERCRMAQATARLLDIAA